MGIMTFLRNRAGALLVGAIGVAIVAFLVGDALTTGQQLAGASSTIVGTIDGQDIHYNEFNQKVEQTSAQFKQQSGGVSNPYMQAMAVDQVWQSEVANVVLGNEFERVGLSVSGDELFDLIQGKNPSPLILQYFGNPQTGQFDRTAVMTSLKSREKDRNLAEQWLILEKEIEKQALQQKYSKLIANSVYVTNLEANDDYTNRNKLVNFKYVNLDYSSILDANVKLEDADYKAYYDEHKQSFENPQETRDFQYVSFNLVPTAADSALIKNQVEKMAQDFRTTPNDSLFAANNSDVKVPFTYLNKGKLDASVDSVVFNLAAGSFYGPVLKGGSYKLVKVVDNRYSPDSVKAAHILINPAQVGGEDKALKLADSLKNAAIGGQSFAELAKKFSVDGSKDKGGDLGTFGRGAMVPEFENAAFNGKAGDIKVVKSQFGVHVLKIEKQIGSSKVVKVAYIEKNVVPSQKTRDIAYKKATTFLNEVKADNFASFAEKQGYTVALADRINANQGFAPGLDNPRQLIRDIYEADKGDVLKQVYSMDNAFVVAQLTSIKPKGQLALADVKKQIEPQVRDAKKAKMLSEKMDAALAGAKSIDALAQKLSKTVTPVQNLVFANPILPGIAQENTLVGTVFGSKVGQLSKTIKGERGVYVFVVDGFTNPAPIGNTFKQKEGMLTSLGQRSLGAAFQALQDKVEIKDNRVKFY